jgi:hypothetical protein
MITIPSAEDELQLKGHENCTKCEELEANKNDATTDKGEGHL